MNTIEESIRDRAVNAQTALLGYVSDLKNVLIALEDSLQKPLEEVVLNTTGVIQSYPVAIEKTATEFSTLQKLLKKERS